MKKLFLLSTAILALASASALSSHSVNAADDVPTYEELDPATGNKILIPAPGWNSNEVRASKVRLIEINHDTPMTFKEYIKNAKYEVFEYVGFIDPSFKSEFDTKYSDMWLPMSLAVNGKHVVFNPKEFGLYEVDVDRGDGTSYRFKVDVRYNSGAGLEIQSYLMGVEIVNTDTSNNSTSASDTTNSASTSDTNNSTSTSTSNSSANLGLSSASASNLNTSTSAETPVAPTWMYSNGRWWYKHANGSYTTKAWEKIDGVWYYFDDEGWMKTGWMNVSGKWHYAYNSGALAVNTTTPDGYRVNYNGEWV